MMSWAKLLQFPDIPDVPEQFRGQAFTIVFAAYLGDEAGGRALLSPVRSLRPDVDTFAMVAPAALSDLAMDPEEPVQFGSTTALLEGLPPSGVDALVAAAGPGSGSPLTMVELRRTA
jgi:hypothetical protein